MNPSATTSGATSTSVSSLARGILEQHQALLDAGNFLIQQCIACARHIYFPREVCPHCGSNDVHLVAPQGSGAVYANTTVRRKTEAGDYNVCIVELDEGVRLMSRVENLPPDAVKIGQRVAARMVVNEGKGRVVFDPVAADGQGAKS
jgi:uncharacterized OB-fold protein